MWHDNETDCDFLNFGSYAKTVSQIIFDAGGEPVSIGVSGAWGTGKSSMIKLIEKDLRERSGDSPVYIFVTFNAWLYQGYDDARAALLDVISSALAAEAKANKGARDAVLKFLKKVDWIRVAGIATQAALFAATGLPPVGHVGTTLSLGRKLLGGSRDQETADQVASTIKEVKGAAKELVRDEESISPPQHIHELRESFEEALKALGKTLVVFVDDLDRCLPETAIATLEAMRLFLFLKRTAFIIAADSHVIKLAVRKHFGDTSDVKLVTSYFDKLIQIPIQVPPLGTQEVKAYLILLTIQKRVSDEAKRERFRGLVCQQLSKSWEGKRVDDDFVSAWSQDLSPRVIEEIRVNMGLAHMLTTASEIAGNPRLIKRFLNALALRESLANSQSISIDSKVLAKLLLLERCGGPQAYQQLVTTVTTNDSGRPEFLAAMEKTVRAGGESSEPLADPWAGSFLKEWLGLAPQLADLDIRKELHVSRESAALISPDDRLSAEGASLLRLLLEKPGEASSLTIELKALSILDMRIVFAKLLERAAREEKWGTPPILSAMLHCIIVDKSLGERFGDFLRTRPASSIEPSIVPKVAKTDWGRGVISFWKTFDGISIPVKTAIDQLEGSAADQSRARKPGGS